jgi:hypothetical protein
MKRKLKYFLKIIAVVLIGCGVFSLYSAIVREVDKHRSRKTYSKNIFLIKPGMKVGTARNLMGELDISSEFAPKTDFEVSSDSTVLICLIYKDSDASDGFPTIKFDPVTMTVVFVYVGECF